MLARALRNTAKSSVGRATAGRSAGVRPAVPLFGQSNLLQARAMWAGATKSGLSGEGGLYVTKYKIVKPGKVGHQKSI